MNIFKSSEQMPETPNTDVVRVAQSYIEVRTQNYVPSTMPTNRDVKNLEPVHRGKHY